VGFDPLWERSYNGEATTSEKILENSLQQAFLNPKWVGPDLLPNGSEPLKKESADFAKAGRYYFQSGVRGIWTCLDSAWVQIR